MDFTKQRRPSGLQLFIIVALPLAALVAPAAASVAGFHADGLGEGFIQHHNALAPEDTSLHGQSSSIVVAVGRMLQCNGTGRSLAQLHVLAAHEATSGALVDASALVQVDCSLQLSTGGHAEGHTGAAWELGPVQQQPLVVSGLRSLDCIVHSDQIARGSSFPAYIFVLVAQGGWRQRLQRCQRL